MSSYYAVLLRQRKRVISDHGPPEPGRQDEPATVRPRATHRPAGCAVAGAAMTSPYVAIDTSGRDAMYAPTTLVLMSPRRRAPRRARAGCAVPGAPHEDTSIPQVRRNMSSLAERIVGLHETLRASNFPHAFGGALALAWCTQRRLQRKGVASRRPGPTLVGRDAPFDVTRVARCSSSTSAQTTLASKS